MKLKRLLKAEHYKSRDNLPDWMTPESPFHQIRGIRQLLGMTQEQLAHRAGQTPRLIRRLEGEEVDPRLSTLQKTAVGLECDLLVRFIPKKPLIQILRQKGEEKALEIVAHSKGTAAMEEQQPDEKVIRQQVKEIAEELIDKKTSLLWKD